MSDLEQTIRKALRELATKRARVERAIEELEALEQERAHIVKAMADLEDALEHITSSAPPRRRTSRRARPPGKVQKAKQGAKKKAAKKAPQADAWTPAKRRAMAARMRKIWATRRKKR